MTDPSTIRPDDFEVIVKVGAEGGSLTLLRRAGDPPMFSARSCDQSLVMLGEGPEVGSVSEWGSWEAAIQALNRHPWPRLYPMKVHADFGQAVWDLVSDPALDVDQHRLDQWAQLCGRVSPERPI